LINFVCYIAFILLTKIDGLHDELGVITLILIFFFFGFVCTGWLLSFLHLMSFLPSFVLCWHAWLELPSVVVYPVLLLFSMLLQDRYVFLSF